MADNVTIPATGSGTATPVVATDDVAGVHYQLFKLVNGTLDSSTPVLMIMAEDQASANLDTGIAAMMRRKDTPVSGADVSADGDYLTGITDVFGRQWMHPIGDFVTVTTTVTRPANTTAYTANDALADTTPTAGGFTFTSAARISGGSGIITDMIASFDDDAGTPLQGELWLFDSSVTAPADNAAWVISDAEALTVVAKIPFALEDIGNQDFFHAQNLNIGFTTVGSANLRFLVKVKNAYTATANSSTITFRLKILQVS